VGEATSCGFCHGSGRCGKCSGRGARTEKAGWLKRAHAEPCPACDGTAICPLCKGAGVAPRELCGADHPGPRSA